ncbi:MAG: AAA family ATPase, partial [bacterium]
MISFRIQGDSISEAHFQLGTGEEHFKALFLNLDRRKRWFNLSATEFREIKLTEKSANTLANNLRHMIYLFNVERLNISQHQISPRLELLPNAANLAQVLHYLHTSNPNQFDRLTRLINTILPEIKAITIPPIDGSSARILVWSIERDSERADLAIPLSESGTGIGQVLAILFVAVTSTLRRTIIIDEPQSFLHPGAIRKLLDILQCKFSQHQYIITTHSPVAITAIELQKVLLVRKEDEESRIEPIDVM